MMQFTQGRCRKEKRTRLFKQGSRLFGHTHYTLSIAYVVVHLLVLSGEWNAATKMPCGMCQVTTSVPLHKGRSEYFGQRCQE